MYLHVQTKYKFMNGRKKLKEAKKESEIAPSSSRQQNNMYVMPPF